MECAHHEGVPAAGTCSICGKFLCSSCASRFDSPLCEKCLLEHNSAIERKCYTDLIITALIFIASFLFYIFTDDTKIDIFIFLALVVTCAYWGRGAFSGGPKNLAVDMKTHGMMTFIQLIVAVVFGFFIAPFAIYKRVREILTARKIRQDIIDGKI